MYVKLIDFLFVYIKVWEFDDIDGLLDGGFIIEKFVLVWFF